MATQHVQAELTELEKVVSGTDDRNKMTAKRTVRVTLDIPVSVELDAMEMLHALPAHDLKPLVSKIVTPRYVRSAEERAQRQRIVEAAYQVARHMENPPRELRDLFWIIHRRAL